MENNYSKIQELLHQKADYQARLNLIPYEGTPEIKDREGQKYLYVRKRVGSRLTSTYVDTPTLTNCISCCSAIPKRPENCASTSDERRRNWLRWVIKKPNYLLV